MSKNTVWKAKQKPIRMPLYDDDNNIVDYTYFDNNDDKNSNAANDYYGGSIEHTETATGRQAAASS